MLTRKRRERGENDDREMKRPGIKRTTPCVIRLSMPVEVLEGVILLLPLVAQKMSVRANDTLDAHKLLYFITPSGQ